MMKHFARRAASSAPISWNSWKLTDLLAIATIAGGVISFSWNAYRDREVKISEHANKVRASAAQLLAKTNALHDALPLSVAQAKQQVVKTKMKLLDAYEPQKEMHALWGSMLGLEAETSARIASLQSDPAYLAFYTFSPRSKQCVDTAIAQIRVDLRAGYKTVLDAIEAARIGLPAAKEGYVPARLYMAVANPLLELEEANAPAVDRLLRPIEQHLLEVIARSDQALTAEAVQRENFLCGAAAPVQAAAK